MLDPKPVWYAFGVWRYINYGLFLIPFVVAFLVSRPSGRKGWLAGALVLSIGALLTLPYSAYVETMKLGPEGFVKYHGGSWLFALGEIVTIFFGLFFVIGAGIGWLASRKSSKSESLRRSIAESREESHYAVMPQDD